MLIGRSVFLLASNQINGLFIQLSQPITTSNPQPNVFTRGGVDYVYVCVCVCCVSTPTTEARIMAGGARWSCESQGLAALC